jgi:hypothetical protein
MVLYITLAMEINPTGQDGHFNTQFKTGPNVNKLWLD